MNEVRVPLNEIMKDLQEARYFMNAANRKIDDIFKQIKDACKPKNQMRKVVKQKVAEIQEKVIEQTMDIEGIKNRARQFGKTREIQLIKEKSVEETEKEFEPDSYLN